MFCPKCGSNIEINDKFCNKCGYNIAANNVIPQPELPSNINEPNQNVQTPPKKPLNKGIVIALVLIPLVLLTIVGTIIFVFVTNRNNKVDEPVTEAVAVSVEAETVANSNYIEYIKKQKAYNTPVEISKQSIDYIESKSDYFANNLPALYYEKCELRSLSSCKYYLPYLFNSIIRVDNVQIIDSSFNDGYSTVYIKEDFTDPSTSEQSIIYGVGYSVGKLPIDSTEGNFTVYLTPIMTAKKDADNDTLVFALSKIEKMVAVQTTEQPNQNNNAANYQPQTPYYSSSPVYYYSAYATVTTRSDDLYIRSSPSVVGKSINTYGHNIVGAARRGTVVSVDRTIVIDGDTWAYIYCTSSSISVGSTYKGGYVSGWARMNGSGYNYLTFID